MTKFKNYMVNEFFADPLDDDIDSMMQLIEKDCKKYLKLLGKNRRPLLRGSKYPGMMGISQVRQDRRTSGATMFGENGVKFLKEWLKKNGYPERTKSIIVTSDRQHTKLFTGGVVGDSFYIFPIGSSWKFAYCKLTDFNFDQEVARSLRKAGKAMEPPTDDETIEMVSDDADLELTNFISNDNFSMAYKRGWEMWFDCKKFYYINASEFDL